MPRAYSLDLRERVVAAAREEALTHGALAARFRAGESTVRVEVFVAGAWPSGASRSSGVSLSASA